MALFPGDDETNRDLHAQFGRYVMGWSNLVAMVRLLIYGYSGAGGHPKDILLGQLPDSALANTLLSLVEIDGTNPNRAAIEQFVLSYRECEAWRDVCVTQARMIAERGSGERVLVGQWATTKGGAGRTSGFELTAADLDRRLAEVEQLTIIAGAIVSSVWDPSGKTLPGTPLRDLPGAPRPGEPPKTQVYYSDEA